MRFKITIEYDSFDKIGLTDADDKLFDEVVKLVRESVKAYYFVCRGISLDPHIAREATNY